MKLAQIKLDPCIGVIEVYVIAYSRPLEFDRCVDRLITNKAYQYKGIMFRAIGFNPNLLTKSADTRQITSLLQSYANDEHYQSWCPSIKVLLGTLQNNIDGGGGIYDAELAPFPFFVLKQHDVALRVLNLGIELGQPGYADEDELLARLGQYQLEGFILGDSNSRGKPTFYEPEQFNQFVTDLRAQHKKWERARRAAT